MSKLNFTDIAAQLRAEAEGLTHERDKLAADAKDASDRAEKILRTLGEVEQRRQCLFRAAKAVEESAKTP